MHDSASTEKQGKTTVDQRNAILIEPRLLSDFFLPLTQYNIWVDTPVDTKTA